MLYIMNKRPTLTLPSGRGIIALVIIFIAFSSTALKATSPLPAREGTGEGPTLRLSLDDCIAMARRQSVDAAVALGRLKSAYWQWRSYKADLLPEVSFSATLPSYNKRYTSYQQADGGVSYVRNDYLGLDGSLYVSQKIWPTGGTLSVETSLDFLHQSGVGGGNQFMSMPDRKSTRLNSSH